MWTAGVYRNRFCQLSPCTGGLCGGHSDFDSVDTSGDVAKFHQVIIRPIQEEDNYRAEIQDPILGDINVEFQTGVPFKVNYFDIEDCEFVAKMEGENGLMSFTATNPESYFQKITVNFRDMGDTIGVVDSLVVTAKDRFGNFQVAFFDKI